MAMTPGVRKLALTTHVTSSVGWFGAVAGFLALAVAGVTSSDPALVRAAYLAMHLVTWFVIIPFSGAAFVTGIAQSLGTSWGLFRHYWVVTKLLLTVVATLILLLHTQPIDRVAALATERLLSGDDLWQLRRQLVGDAAAALFVLLMTTTLSVFKPWGPTPYGLRKLSEELPASRPINRRSPPTVRYLLLAFIVLGALVLLWHLVGGGLHGH